MKLYKTLLILLTTGLILFSGCVYYNTFYNAKKAFDDVENKQIGRNRTRSSNTGGYKKAIEKSLKVLENHPNSKWYDDALYILGVSYYRTAQYSKADRRFRELIANYPESKFIRKVEIFLAQTKLELREEEMAMELFQKIFNSDYDRAMKAEAAFGLGEYYYENNNLEGARNYYQAVRDSLGNDEDKKFAQKFIADSYFEQFKFREAQGAFLQLLGMDPNKREKYHALNRAAQSAFAFMKISEGFDYINELMEDEAYFDSLSSLKILKAEGYEYLEDIEEAVTLYTEVSEQESLNHIAGLAYYRLGLIYQFDYDDLEEAKSNYDLCVENAKSRDYGKDALERSSDIGKLETFKRSIAIDTSLTQEKVDEAAFIQYQLAELYWFNLNKPDTAMMEMQFVVDSFATSFDAPRAMIALSEMYRGYKNDTTAADSILHLLIERYPRSDMLQQTFEILDMRGTAADTGYAKLYIDRAETFLVDEKKYDSALYNYQYVVDNFPESDYYQQARFALIWVNEEHFPPGDSSLIVSYQAFIDSFPSSIWAVEATNRVKTQPVRQLPRNESDTTAEGQLARELDDDRPPGSNSANVDDSVYLDPMEALYVDPFGNKAIMMPNAPIEIREQFIYPPEAYLQAWEGELYFQILLDFSGEVVDYNLKIKSGNEYIDREGLKTVASLVFDIMLIPPEYVNSWFVYKITILKPEHLR